MLHVAIAAISERGSACFVGTANSSKYRNVTGALLLTIIPVETGLRLGEDLLLSLKSEIIAVHLLGV